MKATQGCRCGHAGEPGHVCARGQRCASEYQARLSGPLLDRIDLHVEVAAVSAMDLSLPPPAEGSDEVALRVRAARAHAVKRGVRSNAELDGEELERHAAPDDPGKQLMMQAAEKLRLSARSYTRMLRVARTIADLAEAAQVSRAHVAEALSYRQTIGRQ